MESCRADPPPLTRTLAAVRHFPPFPLAPPSISLSPPPLFDSTPSMLSHSSCSRFGRGHQRGEDSTDTHTQNSFCVPEGSSRCGAVQTRHEQQALLQTGTPGGRYWYSSSKSSSQIPPHPRRCHRFPRSVIFSLPSTCPGGVGREADEAHPEARQAQHQRRWQLGKLAQTKLEARRARSRSRGVQAHGLHAIVLCQDQRAGGGGVRRERLGKGSVGMMRLAAGYFSVQTGWRGALLLWCFVNRRSRQTRSLP